MDQPSVLLALFAAFAAAKVAAEIFERLGQPAVVGELAAGIVVGPSVLGWVPLAGETGRVMLVLAELGVIVLLFAVGLETDPADLRAVGAQASAVGILGIVFPFALGLGVALAAGKELLESSFVATALVATSVGITARVLADLGRMQTRVARIVLGAAVIDDVLGLLILAVVVGISGEAFSAVDAVILSVEALAFVGALLAFGPRIVERMSDVLEAPKLRRARFLIAAAILLGLSAAADEIGLAAIVGAFIAGTVFSRTRDRFALAQQFEPVVDLLAPIFFVVTGAQIDLGALDEGGILGFAFLLTIVAVIGKLGGGLIGARDLPRREALAIGIGMVPRGEVGIVVASLALAGGIVSRDVFGAVLLVVVVTSVLAPPALSRVLSPPVREDPTS